MYWEHLADAGVPLVYKSMLKKLGKEFLKLGIFHSELSLNEMMVCCCGRHSGKSVYAGKGNQVWLQEVVSL
jgi:hypothetical protein